MMITEAKKKRLGITYAARIFSSVGINILTLALPLFTIQLYDRIIAYKSLSTLSLLTLGCITAVILEMLLSYLRSVLTNWITAGYVHTTNMGLLDHLLRAKLDSPALQSPSGLMDRFQGVQAVGGIEVARSANVWAEIPFVFLFLGAVYIIGGRLVILLILLSLVYLSVLFRLRKVFIMKKEAASQAFHGRSDFLMSVLESLFIVKAQAYEERLIRRYEIHSGKTAAWSNQTESIMLLQAQVSRLFSSFAFFGMLVWGGMEAVNGRLTAGELTACVLIGGKALGPIRALASYFFSSSDATVAKSKVKTIQSLPLDIEDNALPLPETIEGRIEIHGTMEYDYPNGLNKKLDIILPARSFVFVQSEVYQGALFCNLILGMKGSFTGKVLIDNYHVQKWDSRMLKGRVGYMSATGALLKGTVLENLSGFDAAYYDAAYHMSEALGLDKFIAAMPKGYESILDQQSSLYLPNGVIQKIALTRTLVHRPRILLFNRADISMDTETLDIFKWVLQRLCGTVTIVFLTDRADEYKKCLEPYQERYKLDLFSKNPTLVLAGAVK